MALFNENQTDFKFQEVFDLISKQKKSQQEVGKLKELLSFISYFHQFNLQNDDLLNNIIENLKLKIYKCGDIIFRYGDPGKNFYIILYGSVEVLIPVETGLANRIAQKIQRKKGIDNELKKKAKKQKEKLIQQDYEKFNQIRNLPSFDSAIGTIFVIKKKLNNVEENEKEKLAQENISNQVQKKTDPRDFLKYMLVSILDKGKAFGEQAIIQNTLRAATMRCRQTSILLYIDKGKYQKFLQLQDQQKFKDIIEFLQFHGFFKD